MEELDWAHLIDVVDVPPLLVLEATPAFGMRLDCDTLRSQLSSIIGRDQLGTNLRVCLGA